METKLVIAADHAGYRLKEYLRKAALERGLQVIDLGTNTEESVDYPDFAASVASYMKSHEDFLGVLICGTGIGMSMVANKFTHLRAALCHTEYEAEVARAHNHANVLCLGGRVLGEEVAKRILFTFLATSFDGGRHQRRLDKMVSLTNHDH